MRSAKTKVPYWAGGGANSWDKVTACKIFCPCDCLVNGKMVDVKSGVVINPQTGYEFVYDAIKGGIRSTAGANAPRTAVESGAFPNVPAGWYSLLITSGYMIDAPVNGETARDLRCSHGAVTGTENGGNFGLADGNGHCVFQSGVDGGEYNSSDSTEASTGERIYAALGSSGHFFRYALTRPDINDGQRGELEVASHATNTGVLIYANDQQYGSGPVPAGEVIMAPSEFRMCGHTSTGWARFDFPALPTNYLDLIKIQAAEWRRGNKVILPYWDSPQ